MDSPSGYTGPNRLETKGGNFDYSNEDEDLLVSDIVDEGITIGVERDHREVTLDVAYEDETIETGILAKLHPQTAKDLGEKLIELAENREQ